MLCKQCESATHIICGLKTNCPCCKKTLQDIWKEDEASYALLMKRLNQKNQKKQKETNHDLEKKIKKNYKRTWKDSN